MPLKSRMKQQAPPPSGVNPAAVGAGAAAVGGVAALALRNPAMAGKIAKGLNTLRQQFMLSGMAPIKSLLGNAGAALETSIETGTLKPLKEMFSRQTLRDAKSAWKSGEIGGAIDAGQVPMGTNAVTRAASKYAPGRVMGAFDVAARKALQRSGLDEKAAEAATMQSPLDPRLAHALDNPLARYTHPFRKQPFNQFIEGLKRMPMGQEGSTRAKAIYMGAGAAHGAATADDEMPMSLPLAMAGSARYAMPYGAAAYLARNLVGGKGGAGIASATLPVSEWGWESSFSDPLKPFPVVGKPAMQTLLEKLGLL